MHQLDLFAEPIPVEVEHVPVQAKSVDEVKTVSSEDDRFSQYHTRDDGQAKTILGYVKQGLKDDRLVKACRKAKVDQYDAFLIRRIAVVANEYTTWSRSKVVGFSCVTACPHYHDPNQKIPKAAKEASSDTEYHQRMAQHHYGRFGFRAAKHEATGKYYPFNSTYFLNTDRIFVLDQETGLLCAKWEDEVTGDEISTYMSHGDFEDYKMTSIRAEVKWNSSTVLFGKRQEIYRSEVYFGMWEYKGQFGYDINTTHADGNGGSSGGRGDMFKDSHCYKDNFTNSEDCKKALELKMDEYYQKLKSADVIKCKSAAKFFKWYEAQVLNPNLF